MPYTFDEKMIINVAKVNRDLRRDGCSGPATIHIKIKGKKKKKIQ